MSESIVLMKEEENNRRIEEEKKIMGERAKEFEDVHNLDRQNRRKAKLIQLAFHGFQLKEEGIILFNSKLILTIFIIIIIIIIIILSTC